MENKTCGECKFYDLHGGCNKIPDVLWLHSTNIACIKFDPKNPTNADKIRQMSGIELANMFADACPPNMNKKCRGSLREDCFTCWLEWLESKVKK